ncbi:hypothetical protein LPJ57_001358 [Coemansia sp. RSA 486]|nr:hypothetical protein LPJ57_001358 [Coemansia sp. RSA 486]
MNTSLFSPHPRRPGGSGQQQDTGSGKIPGALIQFKAGRLFRDGETNWVRPDTRRGLCYIKRNDDGMPVFFWRSRETNTTEETLIVVPGDVTLEKVPQSSGRVYVLKFKSSSRRDFFWMQEDDETADRGLIKKANVVLNIGSDQFDDDEEDDDMDDEEEEEEEEQQQQQQTQRQRTPAALGRRNSREGEVLSRHREQSALARESPGLQTSLASAQVGGVPGGNLRRPSHQPGEDITPMGSNIMDPERLRNLRRLISGIDVPEEYSQPGGSHGALHLGDVLTLDNLSAVLADERLRNALFPTLPDGVPHDREALEQVVRSPQFQQALASLSYVLETGQIAPLVSQLGLDVEASTSVAAFLRAVQKKAEKEKDQQERDNDSQ